MVDTAELVLEGITKVIKHGVDRHSVPECRQLRERSPKLRTRSMKSQLALSDREILTMRGDQLKAAKILSLHGPGEASIKRAQLLLAICDKFTGNREHVARIWLLSCRSPETHYLA